MAAFNPIETLQRLEGAGFKRPQAEALANELQGATVERVTKEELQKALDAQADKLTLRLGGIAAALLAAAVTFSRVFH